MWGGLSIISRARQVEISLVSLAQLHTHSFLPASDKQVGFQQSIAGKCLYNLKLENLDGIILDHYLLVTLLCHNSVLGKCNFKVIGLIYLKLRKIIIITI